MLVGPFSHNPDGPSGGRCAQARGAASERYEATRWRPAQRGPAACHSGLEQLLLGTPHPHPGFRATSVMDVAFIFAKCFQGDFGVELLSANALRGSIYFLLSPQVSERDSTFSQRDWTLSVFTWLLFETFPWMFFLFFLQTSRSVTGSINWSLLCPNKMRRLFSYEGLEEHFQRNKVFTI